jgi:hypothetical protein
MDNYRRLIDTNTVLSDEEITVLKGCIDEVKDDLRRVKKGDAESSLWLMGRLEHLIELLKFNTERKAVTP